MEPTSPEPSSFAPQTPPLQTTPPAESMPAASVMPAPAPIQTIPPQNTAHGVSAWIVLLIFIVGLLLGGIGAWAYFKNAQGSMSQEQSSQPSLVATSSVSDQMNSTSGEATSSLPESAPVASSSSCSSLACFVASVATCSKNASFSTVVTTDFSNIFPFNIKGTFPMKYEIVGGDSARCSIKETFIGNPLTFSYPPSNDPSVKAQADIVVNEMKTQFAGKAGASRTCYGTSNTFNDYFLWNEQPTSKATVFASTCK